MTRLLLTTLLAATAISATPALARDGGRFMERMDANDDGKVTVEDMLQRRTANFEDTDADKNGSLSASEITAAMERRRNERRAARMVKRADTNGNGTIEKAELETATRERFSRLDADKNGELDRSEMRKAYKDRRGKGRKGRRDRDGDR